MRSKREATSSIPNAGGLPIEAERSLNETPPAPRDSSTKCIVNETARGDGPIHLARAHAAR
jgi:hypothetical protein